MNQKEIEKKYPLYKDYLIKSSEPNTKDEVVELQLLDGISAHVECHDRPLLHPFRYRVVTVFELTPVDKQSD